MSPPLSQLQPAQAGFVTVEAALAAGISSHPPLQPPPPARGLIYGPGQGTQSACVHLLPQPARRQAGFFVPVEATSAVSSPTQAYISTPGSSQTSHSP